MDNLTHSLTGALAAKLLETKTKTASPARQQRACFWLFVLCANLPDLDVFLGLFGDPIFSAKHHRGLTHSVLFAPIMAILPALLWYCFAPHEIIPPLRGAKGYLSRIGRRVGIARAIFRNLFTPASRVAHPPQEGKREYDSREGFARFYLIALTGVLLHIFFDVITSYGTRLLLPFSDTRFALDWMFIVDPFFTLPFAVLLACGKFWPKWRKAFAFSAAVFVLGYLGLEVLCSRLAQARTQEALHSNGIAATKVSVLPQPLSVLRWKALAQTESAVYQTFFSLWDKEPPRFVKFENAADAFVARAVATPEVQWYLTFARHPWIRSTPYGEYHVVELADLQFTIDEALINALGSTERFLPFVMRFVYSREGELLRNDFNESRVTRLDNFDARR